MNFCFQGSPDSQRLRKSCESDPDKTVCESAAYSEINDDVSFFLLFWLQKCW